MNEYIIKWDKLCDLIFQATNGRMKSIKEIYALVDEKPIVRCRDCKHKVDNWFGCVCKKFVFPPKNDQSEFDYFTPEDDGFCAWGERNGE